LSITTIAVIKQIDKFAYQSKADHRRMRLFTYVCFCSHDLDLDEMTLICKPDLDVPKTYPHTKYKVFRSRLSIVRGGTVQADTHRQTQPNAVPRRIRT